MSLLLISTSRTLQSSLSRQRFLLPTYRSLPITFKANIQTESQQVKTDSSTSQTRRRRPYGYYLLSIAAGALIGGAYTYRQSQKYEGLMPEYINNPELLERKAMEARPMPPPITKHITFDSPSLIPFPFKLTLYQYVTWFVLIFFMISIDFFIVLVHSAAKFEHI